MQYESERIEYKSQMIDDIYKEVIAFANTDGGVIYLGIDDKGNLIGIDNVDETYTRLTNGIRDAIAPDVTMFVRYVLQDNKVIRIEVSEGSYKPYYLKSKGMKPTGVYVRQGTSSVQASPEQIRQMIKESDGDTFEDSRSLEQELTFDAAKTAFRRYGVEGVRCYPSHKELLPTSLCCFPTSAITQRRLPCSRMSSARSSVTARSLADLCSTSLRMQ